MEMQTFEPRHECRLSQGGVSHLVANKNQLPHVHQPLQSSQILLLPLPGRPKLYGLDDNHLLQVVAVFGPLDFGAELLQIANGLAAPLLVEPGDGAGGPLADRGRLLGNFVESVTDGVLRIQVGGQADFSQDVQSAGGCFQAGDGNQRLDVFDGGSTRGGKLQRGLFAGQEFVGIEVFGPLFQLGGSGGALGGRFNGFLRSRPSLDLNLCLFPVASINIDSFSIIMKPHLYLSNYLRV